MTSIKDRITKNKKTTWAGVAILAVGAVLLALGKITWQEFTIFILLSGLGLGMTDPVKSG